jgi:IS30 family transposase
MSYLELSIEERASIQVGQAQGMSLRHIAQLLGRAPST